MRNEKICFAYAKRKVWKSCVADLRIRFRYIVTPLNFLNPKFQLSRCCLLDLVGNLEGRFCRAWVYKLFTCDIRHICLIGSTCINLSSTIYIGGILKIPISLFRSADSYTKVETQHIFAAIPVLHKVCAWCASLQTMHNEI